MLYVGDKQAVLYKGDFHPAALYKGGQMIAGYDEQTYTGTEITAADTYNDFADVTAIGKAKQDEIPTLDIPVPIELSSGTVTASPENGSTRSPTSLTVPSLFGMDGVYDTFENRVLVDGVWRSRHTQRWGKVAFDGTENLTPHTNPPFIQSETLLFVFRPTIKSKWISRAPTTNVSPCDTFPFLYLMWDSGIQIESYSAMYDYFVFKIHKKRVGYADSDTNSQAMDKIRAWLATQHAAGTPVIIYYQLAEPIVTLGDPQPLSTYPDYTKLSVQGDYPPDVTAQIKTIRR